MIVTRLGIAALAAVNLAACASSAAPGSSSAPSAASPRSPPAAEIILEQHDGLPPAVFNGDSGVSVELLHLAEAADSVPRALLRITGVEHPLAGSVLLATREGSSGEHSYQVAFDGSNHGVLRTVVESSHSRAKLRVTLFLPRLGVMPLEYDAQSSGELDPQAMIANHQRQTRSGRLERLMLVDREYHKNKISRWMRSADKAIDKSCQVDLKVEVDWQSYSDERIIEGNRCADVLGVIDSVCSRDTASRRTLLARVNRVVCEYGEQYSVRLDDTGVLHYALPSDFKWNVYTVFAELYSLLDLTDTVVRDDEGRVLRFAPDAQSKSTSIYIGDGKTMRRLASPAGHAKIAWGPIIHSRLRRTDNGWTVQCPNDRSVVFRPVDDKTRLQVLKEATYVEEPLWQRREFALARDDRGMYYYVDHVAQEFGGQGFRVFRGPRGQVRETTLTDIVDDSAGMIFATKAGKLRLILGQRDDQEAVWIEGKKQRKLVLLPLHSNLALIYNGLGPYDGAHFGTICE